MTWGELFDRAAACGTTEDAVGAALASLRERPSTDESEADP